MKQTIFTFLILTVIALTSCKKNQNDPNINQYDDDQITSYIKANNITGMVRDTSGIYYKVVNPGSGSALQYTDSISMVYSETSLDGKYSSVDTIENHYEEFVGHMYQLNYPYGLMQTITNLVNHRGAIARVIIPSHLAYGVSGFGTGSSTLTTGRIAGNQSLDYYIHIVSDQDAYDQACIKKYITNQGLTSVMKQDPTLGYWYSVSTPGTGTVAITDNSTITATYTIRLVNDVVVNEYNVSGGSTISIPDLGTGLRFGLQKYATAGTLMSFLLPSSLAYGKHVNGLAPANSVIRYDIQIIGVSP